MIGPLGAPDFAPRESRLQRALDAGHDPSPEDNCQPVMAPGEYDALPADHPTKVKTAQWAHQGSPTGCADCGVRCDICDDRMCTRWGPAPLARCSVHPTCADCDEVPTCGDCLRELAHQDRESA